MEFLRERVYTALNADELRAGDKVIVADTMQGLKYKVRANEGIDTLYGITDEGEEKRFSVKAKHETMSTEWHLAYLVERKENCTNCGEGKWDAEHKKILCDPVNCGNGNVVFRNQEVEVCKYWKPKTKKKAEPHFRPFKNIDELVKVWGEKSIEKSGGEWYDYGLTMPHIWVRFKDCKIRDLITGFGRAGVQINAELVDWGELFNEYEFLDGSSCGVEE